VRWVKHDGKWFVFAVKFFVPPVFQLRGDSFNVSDLNLGLGFDARSSPRCVPRRPTTDK
jgi:hypothetical protein